MDMIGKKVLVTTAHRGVFAGELVEDRGKVVTLKGARMCIFWSQEMRGLLGLTTQGPDKGCRISPAVGLVTLRDVTSVMLLSDRAVKAWEAEPWSS